MNQQIGKGFLGGLKQLGVETVEKAAEETGKVFETIITGKELLGDIKPMSDTEMAQKKNEDERKRQEEISQIRAELGQGRNLEQEIQEIREEREREENKEERIEEQEEQREQQEFEMQNSYVQEPMGKKKGPGSGMAKGKKGKASDADMSVTQEYSKKPD
jgi:hypothetical protein